MKFKLELKKSIIEDEIIKHFKANFNPLNPQLDMIVKFDHKDAGFIYKLKILYSTCNINIYDKLDIDCKCGVFDVELTLNNDIKSGKSLGLQLLEIEEKIAEKVES